MGYRLYVFFVVLGVGCCLFPGSVKASDYFVSNGGSDTNPGTLSLPFRTIQKGISTAVAGDQIKVAKGTYFENVVIKNKNNIKILPVGDGEVVIDGAIEALKVKNQGNWKYEGVRYGSYPERNFSVYYYDYPFSSGSYSANYYIMAHTISDADNNDALLFTYSGATTFNLHHVAAQEGAGGYFTPGRVYISLPGNTDPNTKSINVSKNAYVIYVNDNSSRIVIDGGDQKLIVIKNGGRYGILNRSFSTIPNSGNVFRNLKIMNSVNGINYYSGGIFNDNIIENNHIERRSNPGWVWNDVKECDTNYTGNIEDPTKSGCKVQRDGITVNSNYSSGSRSMEGAGIDVAGVTGTNNIFRNNVIIGYHDGIEFRNGPLTYSKVYGNYLKDIQDDGLEFVGNCSNNDVYGNVVIDSMVGISTAFGHIGPSYFHQNVILITKSQPTTYNFIKGQANTWTGSGMKAYREYPGDVSQNAKYYYNTFYTLRDPVSVGSSVASSSVQNYELLNNIIYSQSRIVGATGRAVEEGTVIKSNLFYSMSNPRATGSKNFYFWNGYSSSNNFYDLIDIMNYNAMPSGWINNEEAAPQFVGGDMNDPANYFKLAATSPARKENGMIVATIPSSWPQADILNQRKSIGAYEYNSVEPSPGLTHTPARVRGDANGDNRVDGLDYVVWLNHYGSASTGISSGDFNSDNRIDGLDYVVWLNNFSG